MASTSLFALATEHSVELCRALGLVISNVTMYGMDHSVTATSITRAFDILVSQTDIYGCIELVSGKAGLMINGRPVGPSSSTGQMLFGHLKELGVHDFKLRPPLQRGEFTQFMSILSAAPGSPIIADGFEAAMAEARIKSIRVEGVSYKRVSKNAPRQSASTPRVTTTPGSKSFELDLDDGWETFEGDDTSASLKAEMRVASAASAYLKQKRAVDAEREALLALIRDQGATPEARRGLREQLCSTGMTREEWNDLLLASGVSSSAQTQSDHSIETLHQLLKDVEGLASTGEATSTEHSTESMGHVLEAIGQEVARLSSETKGEVVSLADKVDADREAVTQMEADARSRGIGLNLSREELLSNLAEINQELAQPLTAASAVIGFLGSGKMGDVSEAQREALDVASEGMERLGKLIAYLSTISGLPGGLSPDHDLLDEANGR